jgi:hypothetical protein
VKVGVNVKEFLFVVVFVIVFLFGASYLFGAEIVVTGEAIGQNKAGAFLDNAEEMETLNEYGEVKNSTLSKNLQMKNVQNGLDDNSILVLQGNQNENQEDTGDDINKNTECWEEWNDCSLKAHDKYDACMLEAELSRDSCMDILEDEDFSEAWSYCTSVKENKEQVCEDTLTFELDQCAREYQYCAEWEG